jgi:hypothetical protein
MFSLHCTHEMYVHVVDHRKQITENNGLQFHIVAKDSDNVSPGFWLIKAREVKSNASGLRLLC